jgi:hypothetical protein
VLAFEVGVRCEITNAVDATPEASPVGGIEGIQNVGVLEPFGERIARIALWLKGLRPIWALQN